MVLQTLRVLMKHVLLVLTNASKIGPRRRGTGFFFSEVSHPWHEFEHNGYAVDFGSILGGAPPADGYDEGDEVSKVFRHSKAYVRLQHSRRLNELEVTSYDAIFFPGGLGPMVDMPDNPAVKAAVAKAYDVGLVVGAVCHGPAALLNVRLPSGDYLVQAKRLTAFSNAEEEFYAQGDVPFLLQSALEGQGAKFVAADPWETNAIADGRLVTGQNPASGAAVARGMMELLEASDEGRV